MTLIRNIWNKMDVIGTYVLLLPFLVVQLIGSGVMPQFGPNGFEIVICSDGDLLTGFVDDDGQFHEGGGADLHTSQCIWGITNAPIAQIGTVQMPALLNAWVHFVPSVSDTGLYSANLDTLPPARGPPLTV